MKSMMEELDNLRKRAEKHNKADEMLAAKYGGDAKYMRTHKRIMSNPPPIADQITVFRILLNIKGQADDKISRNESILDNQPYFIKELRPVIKGACRSQNVTLSRPQLDFIDTCISNEYFTERIGVC